MQSSSPNRFNGLLHIPKVCGLELGLVSLPVRSLEGGKALF